MGAYLLEELPPLLGRKRLGQPVFGRAENALNADYQEITEQMGANVPGSPAEVLLLKAMYSLTNGGFEFFQRSHSDTPTNSSD